MAAVPRVVSIEDDLDIFKLIQITLRPLGIELYHASSGSSALEMNNQLKPDLVLLDLALPDTYGWDLLKKMKASENQPKNVVVLSARLQLPTPKMAQERQVAACMSKPFIPAELREKVRSLLCLA
ncbi:MAG: response regulator [Anaerolineae bacterium]|jgi:DNA-binding response OmpR family regulator